MSIDAVVAELNEIVRPDGAELRVTERSDTALRLELDLTNSTCPECVVPKELMLEILATHSDWPQREMMTELRLMCADLVRSLREREEDL